MGIKITTLIENSGGNDQLVQEHGLCIYIETRDGNMLFDTGQSGKFLQNAKALDVDLEKIDRMVISHSHYDHGGGYKELIDTLQKRPILHISKNFFREKYKKTEEGYRRNNAPITEEYLVEQQVPIAYVRDKITYIGRDVFIVSNFQERIQDEKTETPFYIKKNGKYMQDSFRDEIALCIKTFEGLVVIVGCSHPGILSMLNAIVKRTGENIYMVIGGTHLIQAEDKRIAQTIKRFQELGIGYVGVSHCTGENASRMMEDNLQGYFHNHTGTVIEVGKYGDVNVQC